MKGKTTLIIHADSKDVREFDKNIIESKDNGFKVDRSKLVRSFVKMFNEAPEEILERLGYKK